MEAKEEPQQDPQDPPSERSEAAPSGEKEEEEAFLVSLYKFMKERRTPIERIPHLGFKQINLWKIYKAVEKLGAYELVTGRRLWKNVYDELGGSPGSTSAATCTRRHYERLVLPYVRHLKGEDDKPLPPSKPRKQYKVSKGAETGEKSKRTKKEKGREQVPVEKTKSEDARDPTERGQVPEGCSSPVVSTPSPSGGCLSPCRPSPGPSKRLFSSFSSQGNHPIMSPLAKKKLLAQVSKAESLHCHNTPEPPRMPPGPHRHDRRSPEPSGAHDTAPNEVGPNPGVRDTQPCPRAEEGAPASTIFTGCFRAYRDDALTPAAGCHPLWGYFSSFKDFSESPSTFPSRAEEPEQPQDLRSKAGMSQRAAVTGCWVPPGAAFTPPRSKRGREEEEEETALGPGNKLRVVSPFGTESDRRNAGAGSPGGQQGVAKPKAVVAGSGYAAPDVYKGEMLRFPVSFANRVPAAPSLSVNPFVIPAFPSPLVALPTQPSELCRPLATGPGRFPGSYESSLRHRFYPTWQSQPSYAPAFHRPAKL